MARSPALYHGDFHLYETAAIARYVDEAFEGPALQPGEVKARADMQKWINITEQYIYPAVIGDLVLQRLAPKLGLFGGVTNEAVVAAAVPVIAHQLDLIDQALSGDTQYLAGDFSLGRYHGGNHGSVHRPDAGKRRTVRGSARRFGLGPARHLAALL